MGAEIIFGILLAIMFTVIGSATVYQAVILKDPTTQRRLTAPLMLQLILGCLYISDRQRKKESAQKKKNFSVYSKKAVRIKLLIQQHAAVNN